MSDYLTLPLQHRKDAIKIPLRQISQLSAHSISLPLTGAASEAFDPVTSQLRPLYSLLLSS